jgi:hypothetical protein
MAAAEIALRTMLAVVFGVAFISKIRSRAAFTEFAGSLGDIGWLRAPWRAAAAAAIPVLEAAVVALLAVPRAVPAGLAATAVLLCAFTAVTGLEAARGRRVRCRCFGSGTPGTGPEPKAQIARNIVLLAAAAAGLALEPASHGGSGAGQLVAALGLALLAAVALVRWDDLAYLAASR